MDQSTEIGTCTSCNSAGGAATFWAACGAISSWEDDRIFGKKSVEEKNDLEAWHLSLCGNCAVSDYTEYLAKERVDNGSFLIKSLIFVVVLLTIGGLIRGNIGASIAVPGCLAIPVAGYFALQVFKTFLSNRKLQSELMEQPQISAERSLEVLEYTADKARIALINGQRAVRGIQLPQFGTYTHEFPITRETKIVAVGWNPKELLANLDPEWKQAFTRKVTD